MEPGFIWERERIHSFVLGFRCLKIRFKGKNGMKEVAGLRENRGTEISQLR